MRVIIQRVSEASVTINEAIKSSINKGLLVLVGFEDEVVLEETILKLYRNFKNKETVFEFKNIKKYHRKKLTENLSKIIKETV